MNAILHRYCGVFPILAVCTSDGDLIVTSQLIQIGGRTLLECTSPVQRVNDALELVSASIEHQTGLVLLDAQWLPEAFFELRTCFAGDFIQKLLNYGLHIAIVFEPDRAYSERFGEFVAEARSGRQFRAFFDRKEAERWLAESPTA